MENIKPQEGAQQRFMDQEAKEIMLYGGARGGGCNDAVLRLFGTPFNPTLKEDVRMSDPREDRLHAKSIRYCIAAHEGQVRRYTGEPYWYHPIAVATLLLERADPANVDTHMVCAAHLHDVVEDTVHTLQDIRADFNEDIAELVKWLTDTSRPEDGVRAVRKKIDRDRLAEAPARAQTIKLADLIHNSDNIIKHAPKFAKVYIGEVELLLKVLTKGDVTMYRMLTKIVEEYRGNE